MSFRVVNIGSRLAILRLLNCMRSFCSSMSVFCSGLVCEGLPKGLVVCICCVALCILFSISWRIVVSRVAHCFSYCW